jgi:hypothetical protein
MPKRRTLTLSDSQRGELEQMWRRDPRPYMRERVSALLQIADGRSAHWVAQNGLLRHRKPDTIYDWLNAYEQGGAAALVQRPRRKRGFSP